MFAQPPVVSEVVNAATYDKRLCPGGLALVRGTTFGSIAGSISVTVGGAPAHIASSSPIALLIQIPVEQSLGDTALQVTVGQLRSALFPLVLSAYAPAIYPDQEGISFFKSRGPISAFNPAAPGDSVFCLAIGLGATDPMAQTGIPFTGLQAPTRLPTTVSVGGRNAVVDYAGLASGFAPGIYMVSFRVPTDLANGNHPVVLSIGGAAGSQEVLPVALGLPVPTLAANSASFKTDGVVAGSIVSITSNNLGPVDILSAFPATRVGNISVLFNGVPAPIMNVLGSISRVDVVVPAELPDSGFVNLQVRNSLGIGFPITVKLLPFDVGVFVVPDPSKPSRRAAAVRFANSAWLAVPFPMAEALKIPSDCGNRSRVELCGQPATTADLLEIYITGGGKTTPDGDPNGTVLPTGEIAPSSGSPLYRTVVKPVVTIGGLNAEVLFSGLTPGMAGLYQLNVVVPAGVTPGDDVPLTISLPGSTDAATIAIR